MIFLDVFIVLKCSFSDKISIFRQETNYL